MSRPPDTSKGPKPPKAAPVREAAEAFVLARETPTLAAPHARDPLDVKRVMFIVVAALMPCAIAGWYLFGLRVLAMIAVSYAAGGLVEVIVALVRKQEINEGFLVTGLLLPLTLPPGLPLWMVAAGSAFGSLVGKELFGGTGRNLFNPALVGRVFLSLAYPAAMSGHWIKPLCAFPGRLAQYAGTALPEALTGATPLLQAKEGHWSLVSAGSLFWGNVPGSAGETCVPAILLGAALLLITGVANWRTMVASLAGFAALALAMDVLRPGAFAPAYWQLPAGGLLLGVVFMATDPVTGPITNGGKWVYGVLIGAVTVVIRDFTGYREGVMFAILLGNIVAPLLDEIILGLRVRRRRNEP
ncbi:MAG: RnfABCDGE type electron transport complex subunit D [Planctomycetota bacterium]|nr:RnfABCDGE type electron transport complex subunit D [Planctomycetota bacterium]